MTMGRKIRLRTFMFFFICTISLGAFLLLKASFNLVPSISRSRDDLLKNINDYIRMGQKPQEHEGQACRVPVLDVNATEIMELLSPVPKVICDDVKDWVEVIGSTARITTWAKKTHGNIECAFTDIIRDSDHNQHQGSITTTQTEFNFENSDAVHVHCVNTKGVEWHKVLSGIRMDQSIFDRSGWSKVPADALGLNVLMFGFDSLSHNMWKRHMKKTYQYATVDLKGIALNAYNIVGDGTPQALIPILTGSTELELPDTRKRMGAKARYVDIYPFIWKKFRENGYVTAWTEDLPRIGTFTFRLKGFLEPPVDHYTRPFYLETEDEFRSIFLNEVEERKYCYGGMSRYKIMADFIRNMYEVYKDKPKFMFAFHSEYSHDSNDLVVNADNETYLWLKEFNAKGYLNNTLLILMSDHGSRFSEVRNTQQGKQEERLPGIIFVFPDWLFKKHPDLHANFLTNVNRLSTPFDIYETLADVLNFRGAGMGSTLNRGISLFKEIPSSRTCADAGIEPHWCTCLDWDVVPSDYPIVTKAVNHLLNFLNEYTNPHRNLCSKLVINKVIWSAKLLPNRHLLKFKMSADLDGFVGKMTDNTDIMIEVYQLKASFNPGNMIFEASVRYNLKKQTFDLSARDISRINKYKHMTHCIEDFDILHHLRKFCYCVNTKPQILPE